eukprot:scaffold256819_cov17-Tisochrysis_lutea.AAC.2
MKKRGVQFLHACLNLTCTWKSSLMRSRGAVAVRATAPAVPPAKNILLPSTDGTQSQLDAESKEAGSLMMRTEHQLGAVRYLVLSQTVALLPCWAAGGPICPWSLA